MMALYWRIGEISLGSWNSLTLSLLILYADVICQRPLAGTSRNLPSLRSLAGVFWLAGEEAPTRVHVSSDS